MTVTAGGPRLAVGTAGHVDHGKTALLAALTGIDCDRLPEEKRRGITLDLGFAHLERDGVEIGFVDVPGHVDFLHNALAGLGGIRLLLLVVAADEGVRPQTREHLAIAELLEIPELIVVLTKLDLAGEELADLVELEVAELLEPTPFRGAAVVRTSSSTGAGIEPLAAALVARARALGSPPADGPARLPVDRAFQLTGKGLIVTGTLASGRIAPGDTLELAPAGVAARVRAVEVHGHSRELAAAGQRTALQLAGVELAQVARGDELVVPGSLGASRRLLARLRWLAGAPPLEGALAVRLHLLAAERLATARALEPARLEGGQAGLVELRLDRSLAVARGDRLILRRLTPAATLGGGSVLDPGFRRPRGAALGAALVALAGTTEQALVHWCDLAAERGASAAELAPRLAERETRTEQRLAALGAEGLLVADAEGRAGRRYFAPRRLVQLERRLAELFAATFGADRMADGMSRAEAVRRLLPRRALGQADFHLAWLARRGVLELDGDQIRPPGRRAELSGTETGLAAAILGCYEGAGLEGPSPAEVARRLAAKPAIVDGLVQHLIRRGRLVRLPGGLVAAAAVALRLEADLLTTGWERFDVPRFKERFALSRKWAIPWLEHLDGLGVTRRAGNERVLLRRPPPAAHPGG